MEHFLTKCFTYSFQNKNMSAFACSNNKRTECNKASCPFFFLHQTPRTLTSSSRTTFTFSFDVKVPYFFQIWDENPCSEPCAITRLSWLLWHLGRDKPKPQPQIRISVWRRSSWDFPAGCSDSTRLGAYISLSLFVPQSIHCQLLPRDPLWWPIWGTLSLLKLPFVIFCISRGSLGLQICCLDGAAKLSLQRLACKTYATFFYRGKTSPSLGPHRAQGSD